MIQLAIQPTANNRSQVVGNPQTGERAKVSPREFQVNIADGLKLVHQRHLLPDQIAANAPLNVALERIAFEVLSKSGW